MPLPYPAPLVLAPDRRLVYNTPMKICMVTSSYPKYPGDVTAPFIEGIASSVAALGKGNEVHVLAPYHPKVRRKRFENGVHLHFFRYMPIRSLNIWGYAESMEADVRVKRAIYPLTPFVFASSFAALLRLTARHQFDILHAHWVIPNGPVGTLVANIRKLPLVISLHGSDVFVAEHNPILKPVARRCFARADAVSASSDDLVQRAIRIGAPRKRSEVIPYGVDPDRFTPATATDPGAALRQQLGLAADEQIILAVGRLVYKKGFEYLIRAMPAVLAEHPRTRLLIVGGGDLREKLGALIAQLGVSQSVQLSGAVERDQLPLYFSGCDLFVLPSVRDQAGNIDGLPNVLLEAMASGKPAVASNVAGVPLAVHDGENGALVPEKDPSALAAAISHLLADPGLMREMGQASRRRVEADLNWRSVAARFMALYADALTNYNLRHLLSQLVDRRL